MGFRFDSSENAGAISVVWFLLSLAFVASTTWADEAPAVDFSRDVRPILSQYCFACHGPDDGSREGGLRLDLADGFSQELESGSIAIVPGQPEASALIARVFTQEAGEQMPPESTGLKLSNEQKDLLRRWVAEGGAYTEHWSFRPVANPIPPAVQNVAWVRNGIDRFVLARLEREGLKPSPEADRATLLRRLSLDLLGLPPAPEELHAFQSDTSANAYERLVDRLLDSPHFGERWGRHWLDLAHYADSDGYLGDALRPNAWLYRDWVIEAFNQDLPFDQFTIEQLAGDQLPDATLSQQTATGFLRNTLRNTEAGVDLEEYRLKEIVDRVSTVGVGWMGLSLGCAECHSHKFDPISHREFYQLFSFFNNADDVDIPAPQPGELERHATALAAWSTVEERLALTLEEQLTSRDASLQEIDQSLLKKALAVEARRRSSEQKQLIEHARQDASPALKSSIDEYEQHALKKPPAPSTKAMTVAQRKTPRDSYVHVRGDYRRRGEDVSPGTPAVLPPLTFNGERAERLDLARWLVDPSHPLTPRVTVNHFWQHLFGRGLVPTVDNFGSGGEPPSHPELLDWLASEFVERGWSRKEMLRLIVTSATYRQVSHQRDDLFERDPMNVLLARQARFRLEAETIRDVALSASGLLERRIGGPSIRPPQPAYVTSISRNTDWKVTTGPDLYRRGIYILFRRATPYPMLLAFDTPDSTVVCVRRERSNSPLQALTLLNDPVFVECAQALGRQLSDTQNSAFEVRVNFAIENCLGRSGRPDELSRLRLLFEKQSAHYRSNPEAARALISEGHAVLSADRIESLSTHELAEHAAWVVLSRVLLNLDEFITRE